MKELGVDSFYFELVEYCSCNTREELYKREGECIRSQKPQLNNKIQGRTQEEYRKEEREKVLAGKRNITRKTKNPPTPLQKPSLSLQRGEACSKWWLGESEGGRGGPAADF